MKELFRLFLLAGSLLLMAGCIKDPCQDPQHPSRPEWLLTKVVALETRGEPEGGPTIYSATVEEYRYNQHHKPWLHIQYFGPDTSHLQVRTVDTLFFDNKLRVTRKGTLYDYGGKTSLKYFYTGNERYPNREEEYLTDADGITHPPSVREFVYRDTIVDMIMVPFPDTLGLVYSRQGNYIGTYEPIFGLVAEYDGYDNNVNVGRFLNLDFGRVLDVPENRTFLLFSENNWTHQVDVLANNRTLTYDTQGKLIRSVIRYSHPTRVVESRYYYRQL